MAINSYYQHKHIQYTADKKTVKLPDDPFTAYSIFVSCLQHNVATTFEYKGSVYTEEEFVKKLGKGTL